MTLRLYDKKGNVEFDSTSVTLGLIKSCPVSTYYPAWIADFLLMYGHIINKKNLPFNPTDIKQKKARLKGGYLDILDAVGARAIISNYLLATKDYLSPIRLKMQPHTADTDRADVDIQGTGQAWAGYLAFKNAAQNRPNHHIHSTDTGRFVHAFNLALDDNYFNFKSADERVAFIRHFAASYTYLDFVGVDYQEGIDRRIQYYVDIKADVCPIAFLGAKDPWHKKMNFEYAPTIGGYPLLSFDKVIWVDGKWRFCFSSPFFLSALELGRFGVYFFDLYHKKETKVGLNTYDKTGKLTFSTAQPPLKAVYVKLPKLQSLDKIVEAGGGWVLNDAKDVAFYPIDQQHTYATACTWGVSTYETYNGSYVGGYDYADVGKIVGAVCAIGIKGGVALYLSPAFKNTGALSQLVHRDTRRKIRSFAVGDGAYIKHANTHYYKYFSGHVTIDTTHLPFPYNYSPH